MTGLRLALARGFVASALLVTSASAHDGPPFPILVDEDMAGWTLSVWADPDVGTGTFFYYVEPPAGRSPEEIRIRVAASPVDGTSPSVAGVSERAEPNEPFQQVGELPFDHRGLWRTRFELHRAGEPNEVLAALEHDLDVTPPGLGPLDIVWFAFPFVALGALWLRALLAQRAHDRADLRTPISEL